MNNKTTLVVVIAVLVVVLFGGIYWQQGASPRPDYAGMPKTNQESNNEDADGMTTGKPQAVNPPPAPNQAFPTQNVSQVAATGDVDTAASAILAELVDEAMLAAEAEEDASIYAEELQAINEFDTNYEF